MSLLCKKKLVSVLALGHFNLEVISYQACCYAVHFCATDRILKVKELCACISLRHHYAFILVLEIFMPRSVLKLILCVQNTKMTAYVDVDLDCHQKFIAYSSIS